MTLSESDYRAARDSARLALLEAAKVAHVKRATSPTGESLDFATVQDALAAYDAIENARTSSTLGGVRSIVTEIERP